MTDQATRIVPAGWYEDPASTAHVRWWNGLAWTEHTTLKPTRTEVPDGYVQTTTGSVITAETAARIAEARALERQYGISTAEHDIIIQAAAAGSAEDSRAAADDRRYREYTSSGLVGVADERSTTASAWFIALWPVLTLVAAVAAGYVAFYISPDPSVAGIPVVFALVLVPYLLDLLWAAADVRKLRAYGHHPAPAALALLGPLVYLVARRLRVRGSGPLVGLLLLTLGIAGGAAGAYATGASVPVTKALEVQQTIRADLVGSGQLASVTCPILIDSIAIGTEYSCQGITAAGEEKVVRVVFDTRDGDFSYALDLR